VWFLDGNPVVGYSKLKHSVRLLFWSGQSFDEPQLKSEGKFKAAENCGYMFTQSALHDTLGKCSTNIEGQAVKGVNM
jgi:hypothetical protein